MQCVEDRRRLKRRYNYDRSHRWKDPASLWLCPKAGGFQRRPGTGILQDIQSVGQLVIDDYRVFVRWRFDAGAPLHRCDWRDIPPWLPSYDDNDSRSHYGAGVQNTSRRVLDLGSCNGIQHFSRKGLHLPAPKLAQFPGMTHKL